MLTYQITAKKIHAKKINGTTVEAEWRGKVLSLLWLCGHLNANDWAVEFESCAIEMIERKFNERQVRDGRRPVELSRHENLF